MTDNNNFKQEEEEQNQEDKIELYSINFCFNPFAFIISYLFWYALAYFTNLLTLKNVIVSTIILLVTACSLWIEKEE